MINHRPTYHFLPPADWMNDPKLFFHNGEYHMFFQYSPKPNWGLRHWGHTVSTDLVHWKWLPIALTPTPGGPDHQGCYTGCVIRDGEKFHIIYTGVQPQVQCIATSTDLIHWDKRPTPIIDESQKPEGIGDCFRDPHVWREDDKWKMLIGGRLDKPAPGVSPPPDRPNRVMTPGTALLYESDDLLNWRYRHLILVGDPRETSMMFECPDLFPLGDRHVLLTSCDRTWWQIGRWENDLFTPERLGSLDGGHFYASKTLLDDRGRRIAWGWITEGRPKDQQLAAGWSGVMSLPRQLTLREDGLLGIEPVAELAALRGKRWTMPGTRDVTNLGDTTGYLLYDVEGDRVEIAAEFDPGADAEEYGLSVLGCGGTDGVRIMYNARAKQFGKAKLELEDGEPLSIRVFVDGSVVEAFANGRACHTFRHYPTDPHAKQIGIVCGGGSATVRSLNVWQMNSINLKYDA